MVTKKYDLEERTFLFSKNIRKFVKKIKVAFYNRDDIIQLINSSGSIGANYIEANEALSKKDFIHRLKICRKEAKESTYWLRLINVNDDLNEEKRTLIQESIELTHIFGSIITKSSE